MEEEVLYHWKGKAGDSNTSDGDHVSFFYAIFFFSFFVVVKEATRMESEDWLEDDTELHTKD